MTARRIIAAAMAAGAITVAGCGGATVKVVPVTVTAPVATVPTREPALDATECTHKRERLAERRAIAAEANPGEAGVGENAAAMKGLESELAGCS
jgi:hypothetical protein